MFKHKAILIIHGFAGGVYDEEYLANYLEVRRDFDVFSFTLPGHDVKDTRSATEEKWIEESENQLKLLIKRGYKTIYLVGHSMGGVIATHLAKKYLQVKKLVLVAPAFSSIASDEEGGIVAALFKIPDLLKAYSYKEILTRVNKLPISSSKEFFKLVADYKDDIYDINIPTLFVHGSIDQLVPTKSSIEIFEKMKLERKRLIIVNDYYHDIFRGNKVEVICAEIERFLTTKEKKIRKEKLEL